MMMLSSLRWVSANDSTRTTSSRTACTGGKPGRANPISTRKRVEKARAVALERERVIVEGKPHPRDGRIPPPRHEGDRADEGHRTAGGQPTHALVQRRTG